MDPPGLWDSAFQAHNWLSGSTLPNDESFHGMQEWDVFQLTSNVLDRTGEGVLYFAAIACKNNSGTQTYNFSYVLQIDGNTVVSESNIPVPPNDQVGLCLVGQTILNVSGVQMAGMDYDYFPYGDDILFQVVVSELNNMDTTIIYDHIIT